MSEGYGRRLVERITLDATHIEQLLDTARTYVRAQDPTTNLADLDHAGDAFADAVGRIPVDQQPRTLLELAGLVVILEAALDTYGP